MGATDAQVAVVREDKEYLETVGRRVEIRAADVHLYEGRVLGFEIGLVVQDTLDRRHTLAREEGRPL